MLNNRLEWRAMPDQELQRLRAIRFKADQLLDTLVNDLRPFRSKDERLGFRRTPTSPSEEGDVNVTTTCSCLMALALFGQIKSFYQKKDNKAVTDDHKAVIADTIRNLIIAPWKSSGLDENNAFSTTLVLRSYGFLKEAGFVKLSDLPLKDWHLPSPPPPKGAKIGDVKVFPDASSQPGGQKLNLEQIAQILAKDIHHFKIKTYPAASAVVYWFLDGVDRAGFDLESGWSTLCQFAGEEFRRQRSLVTARHTAMMDPVAMAMASCLCARLHRMEKLKVLEAGCHIHDLPTLIELESSIVELFAEQTKSGLWPKYFPLFHYDDAGSNFCYTFELLEAVLLEFGGIKNSTLRSDPVLTGLERALASCEMGRLATAGPAFGDEKTIEYSGWNSGGYLKTLQEAQPESWATAVVHMFLRELSDQLSAHIRERLLIAYGASRTFLDFQSEPRPFSQTLEIKVKLPNGEKDLTEILDEQLVKTFSNFKGESSNRLLRESAKGRLSALLFGPPGTSKTRIAKAIAAELQWPLVEVDPSRFLKKTFQNLYVEAEEIFSDMMDLYGVVILFDELDALVQKRGLESQDTESTFLTTYMLPKLTKLHDRGRSVFLMATNFEDRFDDAIKRAGRFDLLLCMGPPTLEEKCAKLSSFIGSGGGVQAAGELILAYATKFPEIYDQLTLYTFGDFGSFVRALGDSETLLAKLQCLEAGGFKEEVFRDERSVGLKLADLVLLDKSDKKLYEPSPWKRLSELYEAKFFEADIPDNLKLKPAIRYLLERNRSKMQ